MTDQLHTNDTPRGFFAGIANALGMIVGPKGFFGPGFFKDFNEGFKESWDHPQTHGAGDVDVLSEEQQAHRNESELITLDGSTADPFDYLGYDNYLNYLKN